MSERPTPLGDAFANVRGSATDYLSRKLADTERQLAERDKQIEEAREALEFISKMDPFSCNGDPRSAAASALARIDAKGGERE